MTLFYLLLPVYILGNLHCLGMCGPLVLMIGQNPFRYYYFGGRILSFALAGGFAGFAGCVLNLAFEKVHISSLSCFLFGGLFFFMGANLLSGERWLKKSKFLSRLEARISLLMLQNARLPLFLFGFLTVALPCGQTLLVFSSCALEGSVEVGLFNGLAFALFTTPSLFLAMLARPYLPKIKKMERFVLGGSAVTVGLLSCLRGLADLGVVRHLTLSETCHLVLF